MRAWLTEAGLIGCFDAVITGDMVTRSKPDPEIFYMMCEKLGVQPAEMVYVGDNPVRDVEGALDAGYGCMVLFEDAGTADREGKAPTKQPHRRIKSIPELLDIFGPREASAK